MRLFLFFALTNLMAAGLVLAQDAPPQDAPPVESKVVPLGIPCEPGQPTPFGAGFPIQCPPADQQGIMVFIRTSTDGTAAFHATVRFTTADGEQKTSDQVVNRTTDGEWTVLVYQIGRVKTDVLSGNTVDGVDVEELATAAAAPAPPDDSSSPSSPAQE